MRWDIGTVYKTIRKAKGITQQEICGDWISRSNLSKFESNQSVPSYETMEFLLHQIDMSFGEFEYICDYYHSNHRMKIILQFKNYLSVVETEQLLDLTKQCEAYLKAHHDIPISNILRMANILIEIRKNKISSQAQVLAQQLWTDLEKRDTFYESDLNLLSVILYFFPLETIQNITEKILASINKYKHYKEIHSTQFSILANLSTIYLYNNCLDDCQRITEMILPLARQTKRYDKLGFAQVRLGICQRDDDLIQKGLQLLELTEETTLLENLKEEVKQHRTSPFSHVSRGTSAP